MANTPAVLLDPATFDGPTTDDPGTPEAQVTIRDSVFVTEGALRSAIWSGGSAFVDVIDTVVQSYNDDAVFSGEDQELLEFVASHTLTAVERQRSTQLLERNVELRTQQLAAANQALQKEVVERERAERCSRSPVSPPRTSIPGSSTPGCTASWAGC